MNDGFRGWVLAGTYQPQVSSNGGSVELESANLEELVQYIAFDFERFSLSSRESFAIACAETATYNLAAWPLLKLYYSAFFAAHAILRSQGGGLVKLEKPHVNHLNAIVNILSPGHGQVSPGFYIYNAERSRATGRLSVRLTPAPKGGGVHEDFWKYFCTFFEDRAEKAVLEGAANATEFISGVSEISIAIRDRGAGTGAWISGIRNDINYQHKHQVWFPLRRNGDALGVLNRIELTDSNSVRMDISKKKNPISAFANISWYLACLNYELSEILAKRSTAARSFGQKWRRIVEQI